MTRAKSRKVGAVGAIDESLLVFAQTQMVEEEIARFIAQHFMERRPRQLFVERRIEELLDPCTIQTFRPAIHASRTGQTLPGVARGGPARIRLTAILRVTVSHPAGAPSRTSLACHIPTAGEATSANQKYGGISVMQLTRFGRGLSIGRISESSPSSDSSAAKTTRKGAPLHGAIGEEDGDLGRARAAAAWIFGV